jgi:exosome complex RNA-binding protein Rrp42 (RNase PH superfamily)
VFNFADFIRQALFESVIRLDGRSADDYRPLHINLQRSEGRSVSEVQLGSTLVVAVVTGEIVTPHADRPMDGILQFSANINTSRIDATTIQSWELTRLLERAIKDSGAIDTESLCIAGGEKVWQISCAVSVVDDSGGNLADVCILAVVAALRCFRKPDITVRSVLADSVGAAGKVEDTSSSTGSGTLQGFRLVDTGSSSGNIELIVHHSNEREPLPLALHHTPVSITLGLLKQVPRLRNLISYSRA